jgi:hypothetical protein
MSKQWLRYTQENLNIQLFCIHITAKDIAYKRVLSQKDLMFFTLGMEDSKNLRMYE